MTLHVVTAFLDPAPGAAFARAAWPAHITVSTNFVARRSTADVVASLGESLRDTQPLVATPGARAAFGADGDIPVVLVEPARAWRVLHLTVARTLADGGSDFTTPFTGDAYRAHVTDTPAGSWSRAARIDVLHLVQLDAGVARVVAALPLGAEPASFSAPRRP